MRLIKPNTTFDFLSARRRTIALALSTVMIIASLASLAIRGLDLGIDFTGGVLLEVGYPQDADLDKIRKLMSNGGFSDVQVQRFGAATDVLLRLPPQAEGADPNEIRENLRNALASDEPNVDLRRVEFVGPQVGEDLTEAGGLSMIFALLLIFAYVMFRFQWKFSTGAVVALVHDVIITVGIFSIFDKEFTLAIIAALLTIIGYSLNDTIIVFDRIRENLRKYHKNPLEIILNRSVNETLSRTLLTSLTTLFVVVTLFVLGGGIIHDFAFALIIGIVVGTYSSIFVASPILLAWQGRQKKK